MASRIDDRWLWLGLGAFTFLAIKGVSHGLKQVVRLTEARHFNPLQNPFPTQRTFSSASPATTQTDAIKTSSLLTLSTCPNIEIRKAATKILCERFFSSASARKLLLNDLNSNDVQKRHTAQLAFNLLCDYGVVQEIVPPPPPTPRVFGRSSGAPAWWNGSRPRERGSRRGTGGRDSEERDLRRRRREAMVINEGDRPISQEDVYMRDEEGRMSTEEQRAHPMGITEGDDGDEVGRLTGLMHDV